MLARLSKLGLAVNPSKAAKIIKTLGEDHDSEVLHWRTLAEEGVTPSESASQAGRNKTDTDNDPDARSDVSASDDSSDDEWEDLEEEESSSLSSEFHLVLRKNY